MAPLRHVNIVRLWGGCWNEGADKLCIVLEFASKGSLKSLMDRTEVGTWASPRFDWALGLARGFKYLHHELNEPLIHRDLKPDNTLVAGDLTAKVADFGESKHFDEELASEKGRGDVLTMTMVGTLLYCAPEVRVVLTCSLLIYKTKIT